MLRSICAQPVGEWRGTRQNKCMRRKRALRGGCRSSYARCSVMTVEFIIGKRCGSRAAWAASTYVASIAFLG